MAKSFWDEFKDLFKTPAQREEERKKSIDDALEREKDVVKQLEELDQQYKESLTPEPEPDLDALFPEDSGLRERSYDAPTDEELRQQATDKFASEKALKSEKLKDDYDKDVAKAEEKKQEAQQKLDESLLGIAESLNEQGENIKDSAVERGVARGSILKSALEELGKNMGAAASEKRKQYESSLDEIDKNIAALSSEYENALEELDLSYAAKLSDEMDKLKKERDKQVEQIEKYNANIRAQQEKYAREREQDIAEFLQKREQEKLEKQAAHENYERTHGLSGEKQKNYAARYDIAYEFYSSLDPEIAADALEASPNMKYYLGVYYNKLLSELKKRDATGEVYF